MSTFYDCLLFAPHLVTGDCQLMAIRLDSHSGPNLNLINSALCDPDLMAVRTAKKSHGVWSFQIRFWPLSKSDTDQILHYATSVWTGRWPMQEFNVTCPNCPRAAIRDKHKPLSSWNFGWNLFHRGLSHHYPTTSGSDSASPRSTEVAAVDSQRTIIEYRFSSSSLFAYSSFASTLTFFHCTTTWPPCPCLRLYTECCLWRYAVPMSMRVTSGPWLLHAGVMFYKTAWMATLQKLDLERNLKWAWMLVVWT